jgi:hypothetical protein
MEINIKAKGKGTYSAPHILVVGHVTEGIKEEASKGRRRGVGDGVDTCEWEPTSGGKKMTCPGGCQPIYSPILLDSPQGRRSIHQISKSDNEKLDLEVHRRIREEYRAVRQKLTNQQTLQ